MIEILQNYPLADVLIIIIGFVLFVDYIVRKISEIKDKQNDFAIKKTKELKIPVKVKTLEEANMRQQEQIDLLLESDRNRIKMELLKQCHHFQRKGSIDVRSWEGLHQMYEIYKREGGNSWAEEVMKDIDNIKREISI